MQCRRRRGWLPLLRLWQLQRHRMPDCFTSSVASSVALPRGFAGSVASSIATGVAAVIATAVTGGVTSGLAAAIATAVAGGVAQWHCRDLRGRLGIDCRRRYCHFPSLSIPAVARIARGCSFEARSRQSSSRQCHLGVRGAVSNPAGSSEHPPDHPGADTSEHVECPWCHGDIIHAASDHLSSSWGIPFTDGVATVVAGSLATGVPALVAAIVATVVAGSLAPTTAVRRHVSSETCVCL